MYAEFKDAKNRNIRTTYDSSGNETNGDAGGLKEWLDNGQGSTVR